MFYEEKKINFYKNHYGWFIHSLLMKPKNYLSPNEMKSKNLN